MKNHRPFEALESVDRVGCALIDMIDVVLSLKEAGMPLDVMARTVGQDRASIEALLAVARDPVARVLLNAGRLSSVGAWERFMTLSPVTRKRLLDSDEPITAERCEQSAREGRRTSLGPSPTRQIPIQTEEPRT